MSWAPDLNANRLGLQWKAFNSKARCLLLSGPRYSGKTIACLHKIIRHMYDTPGARVAMFSKTMKNSKEGGTWLDINGPIIQEWRDAGIGFDYVSAGNDGKPGWKVIGDTRTPYFAIRNRYGGVSDCRLFSLDYVHDVVDKVKEQRFSMIYFSELMKFDDPIVFSSTLPCLRMMHLRYDEHQWLADTNPSLEGDKSWIYKIFYQQRVWTYEQYLEDCKENEIEPDTEPDFQEYQRGLELLELFPEDNVRLDPKVLKELKRICAYDKGLYDRDVNGLWVFGGGDKSRHFRSFFKPEIHVLGNTESVNEEDYEVIKPHPNSSELILGLDPGDSNHAGIIMDRTYQNGLQCFSVLDELESVGKGGKIQDFMKDASQRVGQWVSLEDFAVALMDLITAIEADAGRTFNLEQCYSDSSALEKYSATANTFPALEIMSGSKGRLVPIGVRKPDGSKMVRVNLVKKLLSTGRLKISAQCFAVQRMLRDLKKGASRLNFIVEDENKHIFDALSYPLIILCADEILTQEDRMNVGKRKQGGGMIHL